jgi:hypothetical protein
MAKASIARVVLVAMCVVGVCAPSALAAAPRNDDFLRSIWINDAAPLTTEEWNDIRRTDEATTQDDLKSVDRNGDPLGGGGAENTRCGQTTFGKTVWYDFKPHVSGGVQLNVSGFNLAVVVYEYDEEPFRLDQIGCAVAQDSRRVVLRLESTQIRKGRRYTVQVGGVRSGPDFDSGMMDFTFRFLPDRDEDSVFDISDGCPRQPGLDTSEGGQGCPPTLNPSWDHGFERVSSGIRLTSLEITDLRSGAEVTARCRRCGDLSQRVTVADGARRVRLSKFVGPTLPAGADLRVRVTRKNTTKGRYRFGAIGRYWRFTVTSDGLVVSAVRCLRPGSTTPRRTCR